MLVLLVAQQEVLFLVVRAQVQLAISPGQAVVAAVAALIPASAVVVAAAAVVRPETRQWGELVLTVPTLPIAVRWVMAEMAARVIPPRVEPVE